MGYIVIHLDNLPEMFMVYRLLWWDMTAMIFDAICLYYLEETDDALTQRTSWEMTADDWGWIRGLAVPAQEVFASTGFDMIMIGI